MSSTGKGKGDLDTIVLRHQKASCEIYLHGATLCSYKTPDDKERIFVSPGAIFDGKKAIRGGVPVVFPQFGQPDKAMPQHGVARNNLWTVKSTEDAKEYSRAIFTLTDNAETRKLWDHAFQLEYEVTLTAVSLNMLLRVVNSGDAPFQFHALLHTYFSIDEIGKTAVCGLTGRNYADKVAGDTKLEDNKEILLPKFTDRIYIGEAAVAKDVTICEAGGSATLYGLTNEATLGGETKPCDVVVWNPYEEASPGDLPPPAFQKFVCVEPGLVNQFHELPAKATATLSQKIVPM